MSNEQLLQAIADIIDQKLDEKLKPIYVRLDKIDDRLDKVEDRLDKVENRLDKIEDRLDKVENRLDKIEVRLDKVEDRLDIVEVKLNRNTRKLENFHLDFKISERNINQNVHALQDEMETVITVLKLHELVPQPTGCQIYYHH